MMDNEIGVALSHYHHKLGPQFVGISFDFSMFDSIVQYNILQDSISSRSSDIALFVTNKQDISYQVRVKKIKIDDPMARGGVQRYAVLLIVPDVVEEDFDVNIDEICDDFVDKLSHGGNVHQSLSAWSTILNDQFASLRPEEELKLVRRLPVKQTNIDLF